MAALLGLHLGTGTIPPLVAGGLAVIAGLCSVARLRPSIRNPDTTEVRDQGADAEADAVTGEESPSPSGEGLGWGSPARRRAMPPHPHPLP